MSNSTTTKSARPSFCFSPERNRITFEAKSKHPNVLGRCFGNDPSNQLDVGSLANRWVPLPRGLHPSAMEGKRSNYCCTYQISHRVINTGRRRLQRYLFRCKSSQRWRTWRPELEKWSATELWVWDIGPFTWRRRPWSPPVCGLDIRLPAALICLCVLWPWLLQTYPRKLCQR